MDPRLSELRSTGRCVLEPFSRQQIAEVNAYLLQRPVFTDSHVAESARKRGAGSVPRQQAGASECICVLPQDVMCAPHLLERALLLATLAGEYVGRQPPTMYSANAFWTRPGSAPLREDIQAFHCDYDDQRFLVMFVFLTDVFGAQWGTQELEGPDGIVRTISGEAGTVFLADTSRRHRGLKPTVQERGIAWFRWGISDVPEANRWDNIEPVDAALLGDRYPLDPYMRDSIKLLAA